MDILKFLNFIEFCEVNILGVPCLKENGEEKGLGFIESLLHDNSYYMIFCIRYAGVKFSECQSSFFYFFSPLSFCVIFNYVLFACVFSFLPLS